MASAFQVKEHILESQHVRHYARATSQSQNQVLRIAVKQYVPKDNNEPQAGDITIIGAHANGFPKELYEPLWEELYARSSANGISIRGIWIADVVHQGQSGILNESILGNDPSWYDHSRDLLHMINHFRKEMPVPIVGIGHSWGAAQLTNLSLFHPRLFTALVLLDPVIQDNRPVGNLVQAQEQLNSGYTPAVASTYRRDVWPSREEAAASFKKQKFYQAWDPRVLDAWIKFGLRDTPTLLHSQEGAVTLTCTKGNEVWTFARPVKSGGEARYDVDPSYQRSDMRTPLYRPEPLDVFQRLPHVQPSTLFIFGDASALSPSALQKEKLERIGTGFGGNGGVKAGRVAAISLKDIGHLVAQEAPIQCAESMAPWISGEIKRWKSEMVEFETWAAQTPVQKASITDEWRTLIGPPMRAPPKNSVGKSKAKI